MITRRNFLRTMAALPLVTTWTKPGLASEIAELDLSEFSKHLRPVGRILEFENYYVWCNAPIDGPDGKVHVFFSRWSATKGMGGWINSSEIAHAVADTPEGPYEVVGTVLAPRGQGHWDATTCHNAH